jgi:DNA-binding CsgD family transcriptional regulator
LGPRELFSRGELLACLRAAEDEPAFRDRVLTVYALMRLRRYAEALDAITLLKPETAEDATLCRALESECHSLQGEMDPARHALAALNATLDDPEVAFEVAYARMLVGWLESSPDAMEAALADCDVRLSPHLHARWLYGSSWAAGLRGDYREQLRLLEQTVMQITDAPVAHDVTLLATATRALVHLVREIAAPGAFECARQTAESIPWTEDLAREHFLTLRGLAWACALRGSHSQALHYSYSARDIAPSKMWVTACYADQAYLARMAGEDSSALALLDHAVECALKTDWQAPGEERVAILNLMELVADRDPAKAQQLLQVYDAIPVSLSPWLAFSRDRRFHAMEEYARGTVLAASGERAAAVLLLENAFRTFVPIGYAWRAAASALRLNAITRDRLWLQRASDAVEEFAESSVAHEIRRKAVGFDASVARLTPAQRRVFELICEGLPDKQIAHELHISPETVKNHAARVRLAFGVHSRAALIAAMRKAV